MKKFILFFVIGLCAAIMIPTSEPEQSTSPEVEQVVTEPQLEAVNKVRAETGKAPLIEDPRLSASAKEKADDLVERNYWSHDTPDGEKFSKLIIEHAPDAEMVGENLSRCNEDPVAAWVDSYPHYQNMIGDWKYWGTGTSHSDECRYDVNHFSR